MEIWDYFRRLIGPLAAEEPAEPLGVQSWHEGICRYVEWDTMETSWAESERLIGRFLSSAVAAAATARNCHPQWLVLTYEPKQGALTLVPSSDPKTDEEDWPVHWTLGSSFLQSEAQRAASNGTSQSMEEHVVHVWKIVSRSLTQGEASQHLAEVRARHPLRLAGYDYFEGKDHGPSRLRESGELA
jgi:hypothetical protein